MQLPFELILPSEILLLISVKKLCRLQLGVVAHTAGIVDAGEL